MDNETLATELLRQLKASARRWFIAFCVMTVLEAVTIAGFIWYISLPVEEIETVTVENDSGNANYIGNDMNGDLYNGKSNENKGTAQNNQTP